jgi:hypothetical protein
VTLTANAASIGLFSTINFDLAVWKHLISVIKEINK